MGNAGCFGRKSNRLKLKQQTTTNQLPFIITLIWLDDEQKTKTELRQCLKQIDRQMIKSDNTDSCETYIRDRPDDHFILIVCFKLGSILVPEIDELPQLDSVFVYDFLTNNAFKSWMKPCQKIIKDVFIDINQLESSIKDHIEYLRKIETTKPEISNANNDLRITSTEIRLRSDTNSSLRSNSGDYDTLYYLIWLDINANNDELTKSELESVIKCQILTFDNVNDCEQCVFNSPNIRAILIVSYELGFVITPRIVSFKQIITILVYSKNSTLYIHRPWTDQYLAKVQPVASDLSTLKTVIQYEFHKCGLYITEGNVPENDIIMDIFNQKEMLTKNLKSEKGSFLWFKLLVEVLIHMKDRKRAHNDLVEILCKSYPQSSFVAEFRDNYTSDKAIEWLTRDDSCLLKELNKALRQQHLDHLFIFRYLMNDIYQQLKKEYDQNLTDKEKTLTLYRIQVISEFELKQLLKTNTDDLIAVNSFMSTWTDRIKAVDFLKRQRQSGFKHILFEIEVGYRKKSNPFARINIKEEDLTLFMLGCIFRIRSITQDNTLDYYVLKLELCSDDDSDLKNIFNYMTNDFIQSETDLITLGILLCKMGESDKARKYFEFLLPELDENDPNRAHCLDGLGNIESDQGKLKEALEHHQQALDLRMNYGSTQANHSLIALSYINIANDYKDMKEYNKALFNVEIALDILRQKNLPEDQVKRAACHTITGAVKLEQEECEEALTEFQQALNIYKQQGLPDDHPDLASIYQNMGLCYLNSGAIINDPFKALEFFKNALAIRLKTLPNNHRSMGLTYRSIGLAYEKLQKYQDALEFLQKALAVYKTLNANSTNVQNIEADIKHIQGCIINISSQPTRHFRSQGFQTQATTNSIDSALKIITTMPQKHLLKMPTQPVNLRLILLGRENTVKHSFGNTLLAQENYFKINQKSSTMTSNDQNHCLVGFRDLFGRILTIVNTPNLNTRDDAYSITEYEIARSLRSLAPGPHAFLLALEFTSKSSYSEEDDKQFIKLITDTFGPEVLQYTVFVFTNLEKLQVAKMDIDQYWKEHQSPSITELMRKCKNRYIAINNQAPPNAKDASFAELMLIIDRMLEENGGIVYSYQPSWKQKQISKFSTNT